jgi:hypothetical protein
MWLLDIGWIICGVVAYLLQRKTHAAKHPLDEWTVGDRCVAMVISFGGPVSLVVLLLRFHVHWGTPARW